MNLRYGLPAALVFTLTACGGGSSSHPRPIDAVTNTAPTTHYISYGQSLSLGTRSTVGAWNVDPAIPSDYVQDVGLMFSGGTRPDDVSALVPFHESLQIGGLGAGNIDVGGETPLYGLLSTLKSIRGAHLASCAGRGSTSIANLGRGSDPYFRVLEQVLAGKQLSPTAYTVPAVIWMQGESDTGNVSYAREFEQLVSDLDPDIRSITGQSIAVQFYSCLPNRPDIAAAQREVAAADSRVHIACDTAEMAKSDGTHLTAAASRAAGVAFGTAIVAQPTP